MCRPVMPCDRRREGREKKRRDEEKKNKAEPSRCAQMYLGNDQPRRSPLDIQRVSVSGSLIRPDGAL